MRALPASIDARLADPAFVAVDLLYLGEPSGGGPEYHWTNAPASLSWDGETWTQRPFRLSELVSDLSGAQAVDLDFLNVDQVITALVLGEGIRDRTVRLYEAWLDVDDTSTVLDAYVTLSGRAGRMEISEEVPDGAAARATLTVIPNSDLGATSGPRESFSLNCRYRDFKGPRCKYSGPETTCDRTFAQCTAYANTINFGGFRHAPTPGSKFLWGGSSVGDEGSRG